MGLEERLFMQISENINPETQVYAATEDLLDKMFAYSSDNLQKELAVALSCGEKHDEILPEDLNGYKIIHTNDGLKNFETKFGIRSSLFDIGVPEEKWEIIRKKTKLGEWYAGVYFPKHLFKEFIHESLPFAILGMSIENIEADIVLYDHEALHAARRTYSRNWDALDSYPRVESYDMAELTARVEIRFLDEILCFLCTGRNEENITTDLKESYLPKEERLIRAFKWLSDEEKERIGFMFIPIEDKVEKVVKAAYWLYDQLSPRMMVPLFFAFGPTLSEMKEGKYISPFSDILNLARLLAEKKITVDKLTRELRKQDYCW